jgi:hypothetical protein
VVNPGKKTIIKIWRLDAFEEVLLQQLPITWEELTFDYTGGWV